MPGHSTSSRDLDEAPHYTARQDVYPPPSSALPSQGSQSLMQRLLGARGLASLTVDVAAPSTRTKATRDSQAATQPQEQRQSRGAQMEEQPKPSRWGTWEFRAYLLIIAVVVPYMAWVPISLSQRE